MTMLNEPFPAEVLTPDVIPLSDLSQEAMARRMPVDPEPEIESGGSLTIELPAGYIAGDGRLLKTATVRELNGFDEERLARVSPVENPAKFVTELLFAGVTDIGGIEPDRKMILDLVLGDRDQLMLGVRRATYGNTIEFDLTCTKCDSQSLVEIDLTDPVDVPVKFMEDPLQRVFEVPLRHGLAKVVLITGTAQELFSENLAKKTSVEVNSLMLSKSVVEIDGIMTMGSLDAVRRLSVVDRETLQKFIWDNQPGPQYNSISVPCATCTEKYQIGLGLLDLFRF